MKHSTTAANASFISNSPTSPASMPAFFSALRVAGRPRQHDARFAADARKRAESGARLEPEFLTGLPVADQHGGRPVGDPRRIAGVMQMADGLDFGISPDRGRVVARLLAHQR